MTNTYPTYKSSGVAWLGDIPAHWEVKKLKYILSVRSGDNLPSNQIKVDGDYPIYGGNGVMGYTDVFNYQEDKIIIGRVGAKCGNVRLVSGKKWVSDNALIVDAKEDNKFVTVLLQVLDLNRLSSQTAQPLITGSLLKEQSIALPPLAEQTAIATYLDSQTARLDTLTEQKRQLIRLLQDERAGIINEAVTRGLDARAPLRDSGLPWLGQIPAHWEVKKLKYLANEIIDTAHKTVPFKENGDYYVVRTSDVRKGKLLIENMRRTDRDGYLEWTERATPEEDDIFFTREAPAGEACVVPGGVPVCLGQRMVLFRMNKSKVLSQFIVYQIYSVVVDEYVCQLSQGSTVSHFNMADIKNIPFVLPDISEQAAIVTYLEMETARIDATIQTVEQEIGLLVEYRSALISEVVTGKLRV